MSPILRLAVLSLLVLLSFPPPVRLNLSASAPRGLYFLSGEGEVAAGDPVLVCLPAGLAKFGRSRGYLSRGRCHGASEAIKRVIARGGDQVHLGLTYLVVNRRIYVYPPVPVEDFAGRRLELWHHGCFTVPHGQVFVLGITAARSWDSRYFGPVPASSVRSKLTPAWR